MFKPIHFGAVLFKTYLGMKDHPGKIRIQNWMGRNFFSHGILLKNEDGVLLKLHANDWITRIILMEGSYEKESVVLAKKIMKDGSVFIDIGANFGLYSCQVNSVNRNIQTIAVDANYKIIPVMVDNIRLNNFQHAISVFNVAMSDTSGFVVLEQPALDNLGTTQTKQGTKGFLNVGCCSLQQLLEENKINKVSLVKIDIEGNEFAVFKHFDFEKYTIENILLEFNHLSEISLETLLNFFASHGFQAFKIDGVILTKGEQDIQENNIWFRYNAQ